MANPRTEPFFASEIDRDLIIQACGDAGTVSLERMDKGLSGSDVWLARWDLERSGVTSKFHVFKIGELAKLEEELTAIHAIPAVIEKGFPSVELYQSGDRALLKQEFVGSDDGKPISLRRHIQTLDPDDAAALIRKLLMVRMAPYIAKEPKLLMTSYGRALERWKEKQDLYSAARQIGEDGINQSLQESCGLTVDMLEEAVTSIASEETEVRLGAVHGDLHTQNIIIDDGGNLNLIDYAWAAERWRLVDFFMLECSLKFLVSPPHARLEDLLELEEELEPTLRTEPPIDWQKWTNRVHGDDLARCGASIEALRQCAGESGALASPEQYRRGLILMTAGLASIPEPINRVFLFHSLGAHVVRARQEAPT